MTNSSTAPIMTCAKFLHHGGTHAQVHRTPDTRPSLPLRRRLLPAAPGLPIRRQGHLRGPRDGPLRRRGADLLDLRDLPPPRPTHPARRPTPTPSTPTSSASSSSSARSTPPSSPTCPGPLRRRRKRPLRVAIDLTLLPYYGQHPLDSREIYRSKAKSGTHSFFAYATAYVILHGQRFTLAVTPVTRSECLKEVLQELLAPGEQGGAQTRLVAVGPRLLQRGDHPLPAAGPAAVPDAGGLPRPQGRSSQRPQRVERLQADEEERVVHATRSRTPRKRRPPSRSA